MCDKIVLMCARNALILPTGATVLKGADISSNCMVSSFDLTPLGTLAKNNFSKRVLTTPKKMVCMGSAQ